MADAAKDGLKIFYSYARADQEYREQLEGHLSNLKRQYHLQTWFDRQIKAGENWEEVLEENLKSADLIILLVSPDFMRSDYCYNKEMAHALARHARGEARVIPILVRHVHWTNAPFSHIQLLPDGARPIKSWPDPDEAFYGVVLEIEKVIQDLLAARRPAQAVQRTGAAGKTKEEWIQEGHDFSRKEQYEKALNAYEEALRLDSNDGYAYRRQGDMLWILRRYGEALSSFERAIQLAPDTYAYYGKGIVLYDFQRYEEALKACERAIQLDRNFAFAHHNKSLVLDNLGRTKEASQARQKAQELGYTG